MEPLEASGGAIAVRTAVTGGPPRRSAGEELPYKALARLRQVGAQMGSWPELLAKFSM